MGPRRSKKPSGSPTTSAPRSDVKLFVDRSLGRYAVANALRLAGFPVVAHDEVFPQGTSDDVWLERAGSEGWVVLSADKAIRRRPSEQDAILQHRVRIVIVTSGNLTAERQGELFVQAGRRIQDKLMSSSPPAAYSLTKDGKLTKLSLRRESRDG